MILDFENDDFQGYCDSTQVGDFYFVGKMRCKDIVVNSIGININGNNSDIKSLIFTFLHEISHALTPYCERKVKGDWVRLDHCDQFYKNFMDIIEIAYVRGFIHKLYTLSELRRKDETKLQYKSDMKRFGGGR